MKTEIRIHLDGSDIPGGPQALIGAVGCGDDVARVELVPVLNVLDVWVTLEEADPRVQALFRLLTHHAVEWTEWHEDRFTEEEKETARLLMIEPNRECEVDGGVEWGTTFDLSEACPACATGCRQTSALFIKGEDVPNLEGHRVARTHFWHILVDERLAAALEDAAVSGLSLRSVYAVMPDQRQVKLRWRQLTAENTLPRMSPRTSGLVREPFSSSLIPCEVCGRNGFLLMQECPTRVVYRDSDLGRALDANYSWENYWSALIREDFRQSVLSRPWLMVTPKVYRVFREAGVTEINWHPVRVEPDKE